MKILFVDLQYDYGIVARGLNYIGEDGFHKTLLKLQHDVETFYYDAYLKPPRFEELQRDLIACADRVRPDLIFFILFENQFSRDTLDYLKSKYMTVNWFCDDQWRFDSFTSVYAPHFTCCITTDKFSVRKYHAIGQPNVIISQWAAIDEHPVPQFTGYQYEVTFVGGIHPYRKWFIEQLRQRGLPVDAFGHGWPNGSVSAENMNRIFRHSKISLNLSNSTCYDARYVLSSMKSLKNHFRSKKNYSQIKARNFGTPFSAVFNLPNMFQGSKIIFPWGTNLPVIKISMRQRF